MWLHPWVHRASLAAARIYYRLTLAGGRVPSEGPALLVANHPNSLLDPILVAAAAGRPVRFLAKAPLFEKLSIGWALRASGSIRVYRQQDDPSVMSRNADALRDAQQALASGSAIALFPEGISHNLPAMSPLKTGTARIALGAAAIAAHDVPVIPVGLVLREKDVFRSDALVIVGEPVAWGDLAHCGAEDADAVRELTARIDAAIRDVTINLEHWEDAPLVECAEAVWAAELGASRDEADRVARINVATSLLGQIRREPEGRYATLVHAVARHSRSLRRLGLVPADLRTDLRNETALWWSLRRIPLVLLPVVLVAVVGWLVWWPAYRFTGVLAVVIGGDRDVRSTYKLLGGLVVYLLWLIALVAAATALADAWMGALVLVAAPALGLAGLWIRERWREAWADARRFFLLRRRPYLLRDLRRRQHEVAERLQALLARSRPAQRPH